MINVKNLSFSYADGTPAFNQVSFCVEQGRCLALLGANGSGKTTLLYSLVGIIPHIMTGEVSGRVEVAGIDISRSGLDEIIRDVGIVQQDPESQIVSTTVEAECAFAPSNFGLSIPEIRKRIGWALDVVGLTGYEESATQNLSYGQKQRLAIAAALTARPSVLLLDEPLSNVDASSRSRIVRALRELKESCQMTLVISTHDMSGIEHVVDYVLLLSNNGEQLAFGPQREVLRNVELLHQAAVSALPMLEVGVGLGLSDPPISVEEMCAFLARRLSGSEAEPIMRAIQTEIATAFRRPRKLPISNPVMQLIDVDFAYPGGRQALTNVNLCINAGDVVGIVGPNGSGKTTLIKHLVGLLRPHKGKVVFRGQDTKSLSVAQLSKDVGVVLQNPDHQLLFSNSVFEEVAHSLQMVGRDESEVYSRVPRALQMVDLWKKQDVYPGKLSFGEKKKLLLASVIVRESQLLVLDEPFFGLDYSGKANLAQLLKSLGESGRTVIVVTHDIDTIAKCASRLVVLHQGRIALDDLTLRVILDPTFEKCGLEPPQFIQLAKRLENEGIEVDLFVGIDRDQWDV